MKTNLIIDIDVAKRSPNTNNDVRETRGFNRVLYRPPNLTARLEHWFPALPRVFDDVNKQSQMHNCSGMPANPSVLY